MLLFSIVKKKGEKISENVPTIHFDFKIFTVNRINCFKIFPLCFPLLIFQEKKKIRVSYFKFKAHVLKPTGRQAINQAFHKLMIITFQTRMSTNVISQEQTVLVVPLICLTIGLGKEPGKNNILCGVVIKLCVLS